MARIWSSASTPGSPNRRSGRHAAGQRRQTGVGRARPILRRHARILHVVDRHAKDQRERSRDSLRPLALAAPLLLLLFFSFGAPIVALLSRAVYEPTIANALPRTIAALRQDSGAGVPGEPVFLALAADLKQAQAAGAVYEFAKALNTRLPGARSQVLRAARIATQDQAASKEAMIKAAPLLGEEQSWAAIRTGTNRFTSFYLLSAFDLRWTERGTIGAVPADQAVFLRVFGRTFLIATHRHARNAGARLSARLRDHQPAARDRRHRPCSGAAAVLDVDPGAHRRLDRDPAEISACSTTCCSGSA